VSFATGGTPSVQVWGLSSALNVASTVYMEADTVATTQPAVTDTYGRNAVWADREVHYHMNETPASGSVDVTGNRADLTVSTGAFNLVDDSWESTSVTDTANVAFTGGTQSQFTLYWSVYTTVRGNYGPAIGLNTPKGWSKASQMHGSGTGVIYAGVDVSTRITSPSNTQTTGSWQSWQYVYDNSTIYLYVDGSLVNSKSSGECTF
jgi:hypothetical protein